MVSGEIRWLLSRNNANKRGQIFYHLPLWWDVLGHRYGMQGKVNIDYTTLNRLVICRLSAGMSHLICLSFIKTKDFTWC